MCRPRIRNAGECCPLEERGTPTEKVEAPAEEVYMEEMKSDRDEARPTPGPRDNVDESTGSDAGLTGGEGPAGPDETVPSKDEAKDSDTK
ncbi:MAG TPA: hypothetical protein VE975_03175 [Actinomycetota bacterium]|nr:hypothetical protein [Actinomycetota bacterium]